MGLVLLALLFALTFEFNSCKLCEDLVGIIQKEMKVSNNTINIIEDFLHGICETIPIKLEKDECLLIVDDIHNITQSIIDGLYPNQICQNLHLCESDLLCLT